MNCTSITPIQWTYNDAMFLYRAPSMYNSTHEQVWVDRTNGHVRASQLFFRPYSNATAAMYEPECEPFNTCNNDQFSFKAYLGRWLGRTTVAAPFTANTILPTLQTSAVTASRSCCGGSDASKRLAAQNGTLAAGTGPGVLGNNTARWKWCSRYWSRKGGVPIIGSLSEPDRMQISAT
jgi:hypothetical protein